MFINTQNNPKTAKKTRFQILTFGLRRFRRWRSSFVNEKKLSQHEPAQSERWDSGKDPSAAPASSPRSDPRCPSKPTRSKIPKRAGRARWLQTPGADVSQSHQRFPEDSGRRDGVARSGAALPSSSQNEAQTPGFSGLPPAWPPGRLQNTEFGCYDRRKLGGMGKKEPPQPLTPQGVAGGCRRQAGGARSEPSPLAYTLIPPPE